VQEQRLVAQGENFDVLVAVIHGSIRCSVTTFVMAGFGQP
jgi:hypothetical protein